MSGFSKYLQKQVTSKSVGLLDRAYGTDIWLEGLEWYAKSNSIITHSAHQRKIDVDVMAKLVAITSVKVRWHKNIEIAETIFDAHLEKIDPEQVVVMGYKSNKMKAFNFLDGDVDLLPTARKTFAFYRNLCLDPEWVTFDTWMLRTLFTKEQALSSRVRYEQLRDIFIVIADKYNIIPYQAQAICWLQMQHEDIKARVMYA